MHNLSFGYIHCVMCIYLSKLYIPLGKMYVYKATAGVWCTLSFFIVAGSCIAFFMPYWLVAPNESVTSVEVQTSKIHLTFKLLNFYSLSRIVT